MIFERSSDNSLYLTIGASGGSRIFPSVFHTILQLEWGRNLLEAVQHARLHDQLFPMILEADSNMPMGIIEGLIHRGHNVTVVDVERMAAASVNAVITERDGRKFGELL
jgi:gamma-glutamyltranspeptidase / glutathione hydrolase / leukotriene-C4 hydrolase